MSPHERTVHWLTKRVGGADASYGRDVAITTCDACREADRFRRFLELMSLVALALRLRSRERTGDQPDAVWRQGLYLGAVLLLTLLATESAASGLVEARRLGLSAIVALSAACALLHLRVPALAFAAGAAIAEGVSVGHGIQAGAFVSACAVAIGGLLAGGHGVGRRHWGMALALGAIVPAAVLSAFLIGAGATETASVIALAWVAPVVLLIGGWLDPRLAAAATTIVFARLAASGFGELGRALAVLQLHGQRDLLLRWLAMGSSVVAAWLVTHRSIRHSTRL